MNLPKIYPAIAIVAGLLVILVGIQLPNLILNKLESKFQQEMPIRNGSKLQQKWSNPSATIYVRFYLFNLTNPSDIVAGGSKPILNQLGPYTFRITRRNKIYQWLEDEHYFQYETIKYYYYEPSLSMGSLEDTIVTLNIPNVVMVQKSKDMIFMARGAIGAKIKQNNESLIIRTSVKNFIIDGYDTPTAFTLGKVKNTISGNSIISDKFGLIYRQNGSSTSGLITAHTGKDDLKKILSIVRWNGKSSMDCWPGRPCQMINGSDGSYFPPLTSKKDTLYIFSSDFNRSLHVKFNKESDFHGLKTFVFKAPSDLFSTSNPSDECFCSANDTDITENGFCSLHGIVDLSPCTLENIPLVLSAPHFLHGHPILINSVVGLKPEPEIHESLIEIEPITGTPLRVNKRIQISVNIKSHHLIKNLPRYSDMVFPIFWVEESFEMDQQIANELDSLVFAKLRIFKYLSIFLLFGGALATICISFVFFHQLFPDYKFQEFKRKEKTTSNEVKQEEENNIKLIPR